jgi:hypothetical protein
MNVRRVVSLTILMSFLLILATSVILYTVPQGRVAYWTNWRLGGLSKDQWTNIHFTVGALFLIGCIVHLLYNWRPTVSYLRTRTRQLIVVTKEFNLALLITVLVTCGAYFELPPFQWVVSLNESIKERAARNYGEPPYGHAELSSLRVFAKRLSLDLALVNQALRQAKIQVDDNEQTLKAIGDANGVSAQHIYEIIKAAQPEPVSQTVPLPETPPTGTGKRTLSDLCAEYGLNTRAVIRSLSVKGIDADPSMTFKQIAERHSLHPVDIYQIIRQGTREQ